MPEPPTNRTVTPGAEALAATRFGPIEHFVEVDSTNRYLLDRARAGEPEGLVAVADSQTAGRGRLGRTWTAPPRGSLLVSVLLRPTIPRCDWHLVTSTAGLAAAHVTRTLTRQSIAPRLKWPNDLVVDAGKLSGLLAESDGDALVLGMGLNVTWPTVPPELEGIATALNLAGATQIPTLEELLVAWLRCWHGWLVIAEAPAGPQRIRAAVERNSATLGRRVRVELADETFEGEAVDIDEQGHLIVDHAGRRRSIAAGDVVHLR
jgi:BirA family transcriptional regulator, biotin operon repressor / biotin---[acetyl-CoA-carboxylase] ligase